MTPDSQQDLLDEAMDQVFGPGYTKTMAGQQTAKPQLVNTAQLLEERGGTHGRFSDNARISQQLKDYMRLQAGYPDLTDIDREALDNIAIKVSRILSGGGRGSFHVDNWDDIAGYAALAANEKRGNAQ